MICSFEGVLIRHLNLLLNLKVCRSDRLRYIIFVVFNNFRRDIQNRLFQVLFQKFVSGDASGCAVAGGPLVDIWVSFFARALSRGIDWRLLGRIETVDLLHSTIDLVVIDATFLQLQLDLVNF